MPKVNKLTPKQELFVKEYLVDLNGTQAAIRAGYSEKSADAISREVLKKPLVAKALTAAMKKREKKIELTQEEVIRDIREIYALAITAKQLATALRAKELLGKHIGMFSDRHIVKVEAELPDDDQKLLENWKKGK